MTSNDREHERLTEAVDEEVREQRKTRPDDVDPTRQQAFETRLDDLDDAAHREPS